MLRVKPVLQLATVSVALFLGMAGCHSEDSPGIIKSGSSTTITSDAPDPSSIGVAVVVGWSVLPVPPASGTPTGTVTVSDGTGVSCSAAVSAGSCSLIPTTAGSKTLVATYSGDSSFDPSSDTEPHSVVAGTRSGSTTTITSDEPDPSAVGAAIVVGWSVLPAPPASGTPTGTVTVSDGTGVSCSAAVSAGSCSLVPTTTGSKTLVATYSGDSSFDPSSDTEPHSVGPSFEPSEPSPGPLTVSLQAGTVNLDGITIRVVATNVDDFFGSAFRVIYNPAHLAFVSMDTSQSFLRDGGVATTFSENHTSVSGSVIVSAARLDAGTNAGVDVTGSRELLRLTFRVIAEIPPDGSAASFGDPKEVRDSVQPPPQGNLIPVNWSGGKFRAGAALR